LPIKEHAMPANHNVTIWHNPRCSKSRGTLELLQERGITPAIVDYQKNPPTAAEIGHALKLLGREPRDLMRKGEPAYTELSLDDPKLTREQLIDAMAKHPILIERPIVFANGKAAIGRPPEAVLAVLKRRQPPSFLGMGYKNTPLRTDGGRAPRGGMSATARSITADRMHPRPSTRETSRGMPAALRDPAPP
jgi:arsenate reductase